MPPLFYHASARPRIRTLKIKNHSLVIFLSIIVFFTGCLPGFTTQTAPQAKNTDSLENNIQPTSSQTRQVPATATTEPTISPSPTRHPTPTPLNLQVEQVEESDHSPLLLVHYMPWYQTPEFHNYWGWHWTMNHFGPDQKGESGRRSIASHYYPLTGPYDSSDPDLLEYQVMLMRVSGIDGVIIDWYGIEDFWDYGTIHQSTKELVHHIEEAGLLFAICYESQTIMHMVENDHLAPEAALTHGQEVMEFLEEHWFPKDSYLKADGQPVLFNFGNPPPYFNTSWDWAQLFTDLDTPPLLVTQDVRLKPIAASSYPWPPMGHVGTGELPQTQLQYYLNEFYSRASRWDYLVASAFPGFHDIYAEAGVHESHGYLDPRGGETFQYTLQRAMDSQPDVIQLVTWNDYGEGTNIEPANEYRYRYLEMVQTLKREDIDPNFPYQEEDLGIPFQIYQLRKQYPDQPQTNKQLDDAVLAVLAGKPEVAHSILAEIRYQKK